MINAKNSKIFLSFSYRKLGKIGKIGLVFLFLLWFCFDFLISNFPVHDSIKRVEGNYTPNFHLNQIDRPIVYNNGVLFTYSDGQKGASHLDQPSRIYVTGSFVQWQKKFKMIKSFNGVYQIFVKNTEANFSQGKYFYRFFVNGLWMNDQEQPFQSVDANGELVSYFILNQNLELILEKNPEEIGENNYRFYLKDQGYTSVYWITQLDRWDLTDHSMTLKNGFWQIDRDIYRPTLYAFWVNGKKILDPLNAEVYKTKAGFEANLFTP